MTTDRGAYEAPLRYRCEDPEHRACTGCQPDWQAMYAEARAHARTLQQRIDGALPYLTAIRNKPSAKGDAARWAHNAAGLLAPSARAEEDR